MTKRHLSEDQQCQLLEGILFDIKKSDWSSILKKAVSDAVTASIMNGPEKWWIPVGETNNEETSC